MKNELLLNTMGWYSKPQYANAAAETLIRNGAVDLRMQRTPRGIMLEFLWPEGKPFWQA